MTFEQDRLSDPRQNKATVDTQLSPRTRFMKKERRRNTPYTSKGDRRKTGCVYNVYLCIQSLPTLAYVCLSTPYYT